jgi:diaminopimelate epimerase
MPHTPFIKMHGLGNDFIMLDLRGGAALPDAARVRALADRRRGIGCDQLIALQAGDGADITMHIYNADGSRVAACGNATRCVGKLLLAETGKPEVKIATDAGILLAKAAEDGQITVQLAPPALGWQDIPLAKNCDTLHVPLGEGGLSDPVAISVGNPHLVFFVADVWAVDVELLGPKLEHHPLLPERANIEFVQRDAPDHLTMRVWERGTGITQACGTGACATLVAAVRRGLCDREATVQMPGGQLRIGWLPESQGGHITMTGDAVEVFRGEIAL